MGVTEPETRAGPFRLDDVQGMNSGFLSRPPQFLEAACCVPKAKILLPQKALTGVA
jgi:hypothetical protein